jgi:Na+/H+ antiporter NhaD/arsenite permease-like protein
VLAGLILCTPKEKRVEAYTTLGLEVIVVIFSIFIVAKAVEHTPLVHHMAEFLKAHQDNGAIELVAYLLTAGISADGAAATLAPVVHRLTEGSMFSAWQLACGICAGSSTLLCRATPATNSRFAPMAASA